MSANSATALADRVEGILVQRYGRENVIRDPGEDLDFLVDAGFCDFAIRCVATPESIVPASGIVTHAAQHHPRSRLEPCLIVPSEHGLPPHEVGHLEERVYLYTPAELQGRLGTDFAAGVDPDAVSKWEAE